MEANSQTKNLYIRFQSRWRNSINQFSKLEEQSKLTKIDTVFKNTSKLKLKMKNRLGQIDEEFNPIFFNNKHKQNYHSTNEKFKVASTNHDTNIFTVDSQGSHRNLEQSLIIQVPELNPEQFDKKFIYKCHQIQQQLVQELTEYNKSRYADAMQSHCSRYNHSFTSMFYSIIDHPKRQLYEFCYLCDEVITQNNHSDKKNYQHVCKAPLTSISRVQQALMKLKILVDYQNNKIFHVFLHNALQPEVNIDELVINVTVLKQSLQLEYEPEEAVLRLRLMNLIGKKIGLLMEQKELQDRLNSICRSKK